MLHIGDDKVKREQECEESGLEAETGELDLSRPRTSSGAVIMSSSSTTTISSSATASCTVGHLLKFTQYLLNLLNIYSIFTQIYSIMYGWIVNFRIDVFNFWNRFHDVE